MGFFAIAGAILGGVSAISNISRNASETKLNRKEKKIEIKGKLDELDVQQADTEEAIGLYEGFLKYSKAQDEFGDLDSLKNIEADSDVDIKAKTMFSDAYENLGLSNVAAGAMGHTGGSSQLVAQEAKEGVISDINTGVSQLSVYKTSLSNIKESKKDYKKLLKSL